MYSNNNNVYNEILTVDYTERVTAEAGQVLNNEITGKICVISDYN